MAGHKDSEGRIHESTTDARAGTTPHVTRYVLIIGTALVVVLFIAIVLGFRP